MCREWVDALEAVMRQSMTEDDTLTPYKEQLQSSTTRSAAVIPPKRGSTVEGTSPTSAYGNGISISPGRPSGFLSADDRAAVPGQPRRSSITDIDRSIGMLRQTRELSVSSLDHSLTPESFIMVPPASGATGRRSASQPSSPRGAVAPSTAASAPSSPRRAFAAPPALSSDEPVAAGLPTLATPHHGRAASVPDAVADPVATARRDNGGSPTSAGAAIISGRPPAYDDVVSRSTFDDFGRPPLYDNACAATIDDDLRRLREDLLVMESAIRPTPPAQPVISSAHPARSLNVAAPASVADPRQTLVSSGS